MRGRDCSGPRSVIEGVSMNNVTNSSEQAINVLRRLHNATRTREQSDERGEDWASTYWGSVEHALRRRLNAFNAFNAFNNSGREW